ncbi:hypothetical protein [Amycolatopsis tolypomycina]|uniref:Uncharacterized protein n=1 Tax=Amycolatopsis tolypomycina TaxID=208445 RepID=A0A1H5AKH5_9PSEU|nr:hypothetical protein [Amycolatopsis tolypomycina]SED42565.1 hypothetical protein SAMN04489727_7821 [Amycolatopsis tolypomycina]
METPCRGPIDVTRVTGFDTGTADPDALRRAVTTSPGYSRAAAEHQAAVLDIVLRVGTTPVPEPRRRRGVVGRLLGRR